MKPDGDKKYVAASISRKRKTCRPPYIKGI